MDHADSYLHSEDEPAGGEPQSVWPTVRSWTITIVLAVVLTVVLRMFVFQAYSIPSPSMVPTLKEGDRVLVWYASKDPSRGDIIVFDRTENSPKEGPNDPDVLIKRVIGLPGETISFDQGSVFVDGNRLEESYLPEGTITEALALGPIIEVPEDHYLVMGDNRGRSLDGRVFGPIDQDLIVGRAVVRIWPLNRLGGL